MKPLPLLSAVLLAATAFACQRGGGDASQQVALETPQQRGSYAQGVSLGRQGRNIPFDVDAFVAGIRDGLSDESRLSEEELQSALTDFIAFMNEESEAEGASNREAGEAFLASNREREGVHVTDSGLQYEVLEEGDGPTPTSTDTVTVHYRGSTLDGEVFDASYDRGEPATFALNQVIRGWTEGLQLMKVGSKYKFYVPADLAYGDNAPPGAPFGPGSTLVFEVELLGIESGVQGQQ